MTTRRINSLFLFMSLMLAPGMVHAQLETLGIGSITPIDALKESMEKSGKASSMNRVTQSLDSQMLDRFNATHKFQLVAASDLKEIIKKQELAQSGNFDATDKSLAQQFKLAGTKYFVITTLDDFEDLTEKIELRTLNKVGLQRKIRLSVVAKVYDSTTAKLLESASFQAQMKTNHFDSPDISKNAESSDALLQKSSQEAAQKVATWVVDRLFPVRVLVKRENQVTLNRGDGGGIEVGQVWNVYALGEDMIDPDTKQSLGREEVLVGKVRVVNITPKFSSAEVLQDNGIDKGAILRLPVATKN